MVIEVGTLVAVGVPTILAVVWLVRLEGRINVGDQRFEDIQNRLERIEHKLDSANGQA